MAKVLHQLLAMNRGLVSNLALARIDLKRMALSAQTYINWMPRVMGSMMLRPGLQYIDSSRNDATARHLEFIKGTDDTALVELTDSVLRTRIDEEIVARPAVTSTFYRWNSGGSTWDASSDTSSLFGDSTDVGYWKDSDESGGVSAIHSTVGYLSLLGNGTASAIRDRKVAVSGANVGVEHAFTIIVTRGQVVLRIGTTEGDDDLLTDRTLRPGYHSIAVTPSADLFIRLSNAQDITALIDSVTIEQAAADMEIPSPWAADNLQYVRGEQSGDVIFVACDGVMPKRIERQGATSPRSWSLVDYAPEDGPFLPLNTGPVRLKGSALTGDIVLTAEKPFFKSTNVGSLFRLTSAGQQVTKRIQAQNTFSDYIRVTGIGTGRVFSIVLAGPTFTASTTVTLQRSVASPGDWTDVITFTATTTGYNYSDTLDNQIIYYRIGVKTAEYTALDDITATVTFSAGSITGIVRATEYLTTTTMNASVLTDLGKADDYTQDWYEGAWSPRRGYPSAVCLFDGRLFWAGKDTIWGSASDLFDSFDDLEEGDQRTIKKSLGSGPVDSINWLMPVLHLLIGSPGAAIVAKASSFDEPLTQTKFGLKPVSNTGTAAIPSVRVDTSGIFVSRSTSRVTELSYDGASYTYVPNDLTAVIPSIGLPGGFVRVGVQRHPDTRVHFVRADGTVCVLLFDKIENVTCWVQVTTDGTVEDVVILPGPPDAPQEDRVYYLVKRTINGSTKRYLEKWALESQAQGYAVNRIGDSGVSYSGVSTTTITGLSHLEGEDVVVWQDGVCPVDAEGEPQTYTVTGGAITLDTAATAVYAGLPYTADWESAKLAVASQAGAPLTQRKIVKGLGVVLADTHAKGLKYGQRFTDVTAETPYQMDALPLVENEKVVDPDYIWRAYDEPSFEFEGEWDSDARVCLRAQAPRPCTVLALVVGVEGHDKS